MSTTVIAHRGASLTFPEHTLAAYQEAVRVGADGIECDVRLTADGEVICFHDSTLDRTTNGTGPVHLRTMPELRNLDYAHGLPSAGEYPGETQLVTLDGLLELAVAANRPFIVAIEIKHPNPADLDLDRAVLRVLERNNWDPTTGTIGQVTISLMSFNPLSVQALCPPTNPASICILTADISLEDIAEDVPESDGAGAELVAQLAEQLRAAIDGGLQLLGAGMVGMAGPSLELARENPDLIRSWIAAGLPVRVWTADQAEDVRYCVDLGIQEITTNVPAETLAVLGR